MTLDAALSAGQLGLVALVAAGYGVRAAMGGASRSARVAKNGSSALLGRGPMEATYWALQPLGRACIRVGITANAITFASLALGIGAGVAIAFGHLGIAALLSTVSALGDALDGLVARASGTSSNAGETLDAAVDRYNELAFCMGLALWLRDSAPWLTVTMAALGASFMVSYSTAKAEALGVEPPRGAMRRSERAVYLTVGAALVPLVALAAPAYARLPIQAVLVLVAVVGNLSAIRRLTAIARLVRVRDDALAAGAAQAAVTPAAPAEAEASNTNVVRLPVAAPPLPFAIRRRVRRTDPERSLEPPLMPLRVPDLRTLGKHQLASLAATVVDFGTMTLLVEFAHFSPVAATPMGALGGAIVNFSIGRHWVFRGSPAAVQQQMFRYAQVSAASLGWNTLGEYLFFHRLGVQYFVARLVTSVMVSLAWNYPLQRKYVFPRAAEDTNQRLGHLP